MYIDRHRPRGWVLTIVATLGAASFAGCSSRPAGVDVIRLPTGGPAPVSTYTELIAPGAPTELPPGMHPAGAAAYAGPGAIFTVGDILLCTVGKPGSVQIVGVSAAHAAVPLRVVAFATRPNPLLQDPPGDLLGLNAGSLDQWGFEHGQSEVTPCPIGYQHIFPSTRRATTELAVSFERPSTASHSEDTGLAVSYRDSDGSVHTMTVPLDITLCSDAETSCVSHG